MRTRAENLSILRNASGGSFSAGGPSGERVRSRDESLRILGSPLGGAVERSETEGGTSAASASAQPPYRFATLSTSPSRGRLEKGAPVGEPWNPHPYAPSTSSGAYAPPSPQGEGRSREQVQQELNDSQTRYKQLLLTAPYAANAQDSAEISKQLKAEQEKIQSLRSELEPLAAPSTNAERDSLIQRMNAITENEGYATTVEQADAVQQEKQDTRQRLHRLDEELGNAARFYDSGERAGAVTKGALKQTGSAYTNFMGTLQGVGNRLNELSPDENAALYGIDYGELEKEEQRLYEKADTVAASAAKDIEQAKEGLSALGQAGVDISTNLIQMGIDAAGRAAGLGMLPFFVRAAGGSMQEARQAGASTGQQFAYGLAKGAIEVGTEKLFDGLAGVFGKGAADDVIEGLIGKLSGSNTGRSLLRAIAGAAGEGTEEVISDLLDPFAKLIYNDQALKEAWENRAELRSQMLYDYLIGAAMGGLGSVTGAVTGQYAEKNAVLAGMDGQVQAQMETAPLVQTPVQTKAQTQSQAKARAQALQDQTPQPGTEQKNTALEQAESTAVNTDPAQHTAVEQAVIDEYQAAVDDNLRVIVEGYKANPNRAFARHTISQVTERQTKDAENLLGGNYTGFTNAINSNGIKHILKEHGENGVVDHSMADVNDLARIAYVLDNYDTVNQATYASGDIKYSQEFRGKNNRPAPMLVFAKKVNGTYYVIEAVPDTQYKKFWVVSAYMEKKGGVTQAPNAQGQGITPETSLASSPPETNISDNSIVQIGEKYNSKPQPSTETGNTVGHSSKGAPLGGAVERSETEGGTTAEEAEANTDPAAAARRQQYQTGIAAALEAGDYPHALKLFNEFGNPNLRALNEVQTLKAFTEFANDAGYGISPAATEEFTGNNPVKNWPQETNSTTAAEKSTEDESIRKFRKDITSISLCVRLSPM